jgi:hypothetical protein
MSGTGTEHRIRSLRWHVAAGTTDEAFAWRSFLRNQGFDVLLPELERQLNFATSNGETVRIPSLHLRLRLASPDELASQLPDAIREQLRDVVLTNLGSVSIAGDVKAGEQAPDATGEEEERLWSFLRTGFLPWTAIGSPDELTAFLVAARKRLWPAIVAVLRRQRQSPSVLFRLLQLIPLAEIGAALEDCFELVRPDTARTMVREWLQALVGEATVGSRHARLGLMAALLAPVTGGEGRAAMAEASIVLAEMAASVVADCERSQVEKWLAVLSPGTSAFFAPLLQQEMREEEPRQVIGQQSGRKQPPAFYPEAGSVEQRSIDPPSPPITPRPEVAAIPLILEVQTDFSSEAAKDLYPLRVAQAGLVLLHPYLCRLLVHCNLMEPGGKVLPPFALPRIAALLHYLATGREEVMEFELGLIKILLGLDPLAPLPVVGGLLSEADKAEAQALLTAAITHWSALKKTSAQGLRTSFLERPGILREIESGWQLTVERRGWDVLLEQLPWSLSLVRLPWMNRFVAVEW